VQNNNQEVETENTATTEPLTTKQKKEQQFARNAELLRLLHAKYPNCFIDFFAKKENTTPLKPVGLGIHKQIKIENPDISSQQLRQIMQIYTRNHRYLKIMQAGAARVDLQGKPSGDSVTEAQAATAQEKLATHKAKWKAKKCARE